MDKFAAREKEVFSALGALMQSKCEFAVVGGYAVNAYALPRFSVDCDLVASKDGALKVAHKLLACGFHRVPALKHTAYSNFVRLEKEVLPDIIAAFDILYEEVHDRQSGATFAAKWVLDHSSLVSLPAKTFAGQLMVRVIDADALFVMKFCCARATDIRDIFMLCDKVEDWEWVRTELAARVDLAAQHRKIMRKVSGSEFRKDLGGVYGYVEPAAFGKRLKILEAMMQ